MNAHVPTKHEVETFTGRYVDTRNPKAETICLEDIAHALAATCRYGGHCQRFFSVAEHAVLVSNRIARKGGTAAEQLAGLHHDDPEAYLGDIPRPMKPLLGRAYEVLTDRMEREICKALNATHETTPIYPADMHAAAVKDADNWALFVEARHLLPSRGVNWTGAALEDWNISFDSSKRIVTPSYWTRGVTPQIAEALYLTRHAELTREV